MKKKMSTYWWCQVIFCSVSIISGTFFYFAIPSFITFSFYPWLLLDTIIAVLFLHLMRIFIIKKRLLELNVLKKIIAIIPVTVMFSFGYSVISVYIPQTFNWESKIFNAYSFRNKLIMNFFSDFFFFGFWNLVYFIYHYINTNRRQEIETVRLESQLKIQQLEADKAQAEFQRNLADVSLTALRSQMNPHFIFNCLNSIKLYTAQNDNVAAAEYLTKFSKLIRLVMENSRNDKISLASELNALHLYIEMEAMRFKEKLQYNMNVEKDVESDYIEIPPLLLQPYVENAIWHGLMHKEQGGKIDIDIYMKDNKSLLEINIIDNGIGRARSAELKSKTVTKHKSYGMKVTSERIALINQIYKTGADVKIFDLNDAEGNASGTKVTIQIPV
jgi:sensor histidine kinase YesM